MFLRQIGDHIVRHGAGKTGPFWNLTPEEKEIFFNKTNVTDRVNFYGEGSVYR